MLFIEITTEGLGSSPGLCPVVHLICVEVTDVVVQVMPSNLTEVAPSTKLLPVIVITSFPETLPYLGDIDVIVAVLVLV